MDSKYRSIDGLQLRSGFYKSVHKGEDAWLQKPGVQVSDTDGKWPPSLVVLKALRPWLICQKLEHHNKMPSSTTSFARAGPRTFLAHSFSQRIVSLYYRGRKHTGKIHNFDILPVTPGIGAVKADIFGVFDGHGGKQAATYASRNLVERLQAVLQEHTSLESDLQEPCSLQRLRTLDAVEDRTWQLWDAQDRVIQKLPSSLVECFSQLQSDFFKQAKVYAPFFRPAPFSHR